MAIGHTLRRIDSHQHFWRFNEREFGWIDDSMAAIRHDFLPHDLRPILDVSGIGRTVAVQARQGLEETDWLLALAEDISWIAGVVGWVPLVNVDVEEILGRLSTNRRLRGVRHVLQAEPIDYMNRADFNRGLALLPALGLTYDLLVVDDQLDAAVQLVDRHPKQEFVLDHLAKPKIASHVFEPWRSGIGELAKRPHVCCKLSGMITEADHSSWSEDQLLPYFDTVLDAFGTNRLMFGSDWPVCTVAGSYSRWVEVVLGFISKLSSDEQDRIMGLNAIDFYKLGLSELNARPDHVD